MASIIDNPIALLFISFAIGAFFHGILSSVRWYQKFYNLNYLNDALTKKLGVLWIEWLILNTPLRIFNQKLRIKGRPSKSELLSLRKVMVAAELSHLIGFVTLLAVNLYYVLSGKSILLIMGLFVLNVCFNLYTALTQQYNKRRLQKVLDILER